ncbi:MAG TPA: hypothetical protein VFH38_09020 [Jatrophihabitans sp.]|nr:hypothetical protein [Jatrophihabitans sp.]
MFTRKIATVAAAAGAAAIVAAPAAFAAGLTYNISAGTHHSGTAAYVGKTAKGTTIKFSDTTSGLDLGCAGGTASGAVTLGRKVSASKAGTITKTTWKNCSGPGGLVLVPAQVGTWYLNGRGKTVNGNTPVYVSNVKANVAASPTPSLCKFTVTGAADGVYHNGTHKLSLAPAKKSGHQLKVSNVTGCLGTINNGDIVTFQATYVISSTSGAIKISSN